MKRVLTLLIGSILVLSCNDTEKKEPVAEKPAVHDSISQVDQRPNSNPYVEVDVSPMDMSYFPVDYPKLKMAKKTTESPLARVVYSRPHLQGRQLFPSVLKYGEMWRLGANETTELQLFKDATIQDKKIPAGRYVLYCIPQKDKWTVVLNKNIDSWGLEPDPSQDVAKFDIPVKITPNNLEYFTMMFAKKDPGAELIMAWGNAEARLPLRF